MCTIGAWVLADAPSGGIGAVDNGRKTTGHLFLPVDKCRSGEIFTRSRQNDTIAPQMRSRRAKSGRLTRRGRPEMPVLWAFLWITRFADALALKSPINFLPSRVPVTPPCG